MTEFITYRLSATGIWRYEFCLNGEKYGSASSILSPSEPVRIEGPDFQWYSRFDIDTDIIPGTSRRVMDNRNGEEVYRIVWWKPDLYEVRTKDRFVLVEIRNGSYLFGTPGAPVTVLTERTNREPRLISGRDAEARFRTVFFDPVSPAYRIMALSFPALRFC